MGIDAFLIVGINIVISAFVGYGTAAFQIGKYKNKIDTLDTTLGKDEHSGLRRTVSEVKDKVIACEATLKANEPLIKRESPISLTDRGEKFLKDSGGDMFIDNNFDELSDAIENKKPKTAYDVQVYSKEVLKDLTGQDRFNDLKEYLFREGLELQDLLVVMGIYLRDKTLSKKGWNREDIDKYDPNYSNKQS